jgi:hypothetical protein
MLLHLDNAIQRLNRHLDGRISALTILNIAVHLIFFGLMAKSAVMLLTHTGGNYSELVLLYLANIGCPLILLLLQVISKGCDAMTCGYTYLLAIIGRLIFEHVYEINCSFEYRFFVVYVIYAVSLILLHVIIGGFF